MARRLLALLLALCLALVGGVASAYWRSGGAGDGSARVGTLNAPTAVTATSTAYSGSASLTWTAPSGTAPTGYRVTRTASGGLTSYTCGTSATTTITSTACTDSPVADGSYTYTVTAVFRSWTASRTSAPVTITNPAPTSTTLAASPAAPVVGQTVTYTATVTSGGSPVSSGTVAFTDSGSTVACTGGSRTLDAAGRATCSLAYTAAGGHTVRATYAGVPAFTGSASNDVALSVAMASTTTTLTSSATPVVKGQQVTYTATVAVTAPGAGTPTGSVTFKDGGVAISCTGANPVALDGALRASCTTTAAQSGTRSISATYAGDAGYAASTGTVNQGVRPQAPTAFTISSDTGVLASDFVTRTAAQTVTVTTEPGATVAFTRNGTTTTATANGSGVASAAFTLAEGDSSFSVTATVGGLQSDATTQLVRLDSKLPTSVTVALNGGTTGTNGWWTAAPTVVATGVDPAPSSGIALTEVSTNNGSSWTTVPATLTPGEGTTTYLFRVTDTAGNVFTQAAGTTVKVDTVAPTQSLSSANAAGWYSTTVPLAVTASDATSQLAKVEWSKDGAVWTQVASGADFAGTFGDTASGSLRYRATDAAGNVATTGPVAIKVDTTLPTVSGLSGSGSPAKVSGSSADVGTVQSGVVKVEFALFSGGCWTGTAQGKDATYDGSSSIASCGFTVAATAPGSWTVNVGKLKNAQHTLRVRVADAAGNVFTTSASSSPADFSFAG